MLLCPWILDEYGPRIGFAVPAGLMVFATIAFWLGKYKFVHIPRAGTGFVRECFSGEGLKTIGKLFIIYLFVAMFWSLFDQSQSAWVLQATKMDLKWLGINWLPAQIQFVNSFFIMLLIPAFSYVIYPAINKVFPLTALRKIAIGLFVGVLSFVVPALVEARIDGGDVFKCSSSSTIPGLEPVRLIDGLTDGSGWSSDSAPSAEKPVEIVIRLRQRTAWKTGHIAISPATTLSYREIAATLDNLALDKVRQVARHKDDGDATDSLTEEAERLKAAAKEAKKAAKQAMKSAQQNKRAAGAQAARDVAMAALVELGEDVTCLDDRAYNAKDISIFLGNFTDKLIPTPLCALEDRQQVTNPTQYAVDSGWTHVGDYSLDQLEPNTGSVGFQDFDPMEATHLLVHVKSNYGADRVKIGEISVYTEQAIPAASEATAAEIWPNVAALGHKPSVGWQFLAYLILTAAEIMVSITCLEFSYTQAPKKMKSFIMAVYLLSISLGNTFTGVVNRMIQNPDDTSKLAGANYYWFFTMAMLVTAVIFIPIARRYPVKNYIQDEAPAESD
jgi:hypothetical protein